MDQPEKEPLLGPRGTSVNNPLRPGSSSEDSAPTASVTYSSIQGEAQKVYARRWYCLFLYSLLCFIYGLAQTAIGPIAHATESAFGWSNASIALLSIWPMFMYVLSIGFCSWLLGVKGVRVVCLLGAFALAAGTGIRCITSEPPFCDWTFNIGQLLVGVCSAAVYGAPTTFSNVWFPPDQRTLSTATAAIGNAFGIGMGSILGPLLVKVRFKPHHNATYIGNISTPVPFSHTTALPGYIYEMRESVMFLMYIEFGLALAVLLAMLVYFPAKPPTPPSVSASSDRVDFRRGLVAIFSCKQFWLVAAIYALSNGMLSGFGSVLDVNMASAHVPRDQLVTGWMSLGSLVASIVYCVIISSLADRIRKYIKYMMLASFVVAFGMFFWFALIVQGIAPVNYVSLYISYIIGCALLLGCAPVFNELACDATYPIAEGLTTGTLNCLSNLISLAFLVVLMVPSIGTVWMNWVMAGSAGLCVPLLVLFSTPEGRLQVDMARHLEESEDTSSYGATDQGAPRV